MMAVAEELSFSRAAQKLHLTQPPVTLTIQQLEEELGVRLFLRNRRSVQLTPAGQRFVEEARQVMERLEKAVRAVRQTAQGQAGEITVGFLAPTVFEILPKALERFRKKIPGVEVRLEIQDLKLQVEEIKRASCDLYLGVYRKPDRSFDSRLLLRGGLKAMLSPGHRLARARNLSVRDLAHETLLLPTATYAPDLKNDVLEFCRKKGGFEPKYIENLDSPSLIIYSRSGAGVAILPETLGSPMLTALVGVPFREKTPQVRSGAVWPRSKETPALMALIGEVLRSAGEQERSKGA